MFNINIQWDEIKQIGDELRQINETLKSLVEALTPPPASRIIFFADEDGKQRRVESMFLKVSQVLPLAIAIQDKFGNVAKVDGAPAWELTDATLGTLEVAEGGLSAVLKPAGPVGICKVQVKADADLGEGVKELLGELEIEFLAGDAAAIAIAAGQAFEPAPIEPAPIEPAPSV